METVESTENTLFVGRWCIREGATGVLCKNWDGHTIGQTVPEPKCPKNENCQFAFQAKQTEGFHQ
jgi:hypothetical protein